MQTDPGGGQVLVGARVRVHCRPARPAAAGEPGPGAVRHRGPAERGAAGRVPHHPALGVRQVTGTQRNPARQLCPCQVFRAAACLAAGLGGLRGGAGGAALPAPQAGRQPGRAPAQGEGQHAGAEAGAAGVQAGGEIAGTSHITAIFNLMFHSCFQKIMKTISSIFLWEHNQVMSQGDTV